MIKANKGMIEIDGSIPIVCAELSGIVKALAVEGKKKEFEELVKKL